MHRDLALNLAELVQFVISKASLLYLFDDARAASTRSDTFEDIRLIDRRINDLWIDSKKPDDQRPRWNNQHDLHKSLRRVTVVSPPIMPGAFPVAEPSPQPPINSSENPLNFSLPAYETMWRVVLRCFTEIRLRDAVAEAECTEVLERYLHEGHDGGAKDNAHTPGLKLSEEQSGFMPFASYWTADKSETKAFAMKMIVLLVSVLHNGLAHSWRLADNMRLPQRSIPLDSDRQAYGNLFVAKVQVK